jgi:tRNA(Ile)-lysidine synthase TilS/MesJ
MTDTQVIDDITFYRPFIDVDKSDIYKMAKSCSIQHLPNSTPVWSQRGKIRDLVRPCLESWNPQIVLGLFHIATNFSETEEFIKSAAVGYAAKFKDHGQCTFEQVPQAKQFWTIFFRTCSIYTTSKSIENFIFKIKTITDNQNITLNKDTTINVLKKGHTISLVLANIDSHEGSSRRGAYVGTAAFCGAK